MNGTVPGCTDKTPFMAALEDTLTVFLYSLLVALTAVLVTDDFQPSMLVMPFLVAGIQGVRTWASVRKIQLPAQSAEEEKEVEP